MSATRQKTTPYWHPQFPTVDGRRYCAIERKDAAGLLRQHRADRSVYLQRDTYGRRWYVLLTPGLHYESGRVCMPLRAPKATA